MHVYVQTPQKIIFVNLEAKFIIPFKALIIDT